MSGRFDTCWQKSRELEAKIAACKASVAGLRDEVGGAKDAVTAVLSKIAFPAGHDSVEDRPRDEEPSTTSTTNTDAVTGLLSRPRRSGTFFVVHESTLPSIQFVGEPINLAKEFFVHFPDLPEPVDGFFAVLLDESLMQEQRSLLRISSSRWKDEVRAIGAGAGGEEGTQLCIPSNFHPFLKMIRDKHKIGWVDFIASIGVNVDKGEVLRYMGKLYAEHVVHGQWLLSLEALAEAEQRVWMFQETAFGSLDSEAAETLVSLVRALGVEARDRAGDEATLRAFFQAVGMFARLLACRGYERALPSNSKLHTLYDAEKGEIESQGCIIGGLKKDAFDLLLFDAAGAAPSELALLHTAALFSLDDNKYSALAPWMTAQLCAAGHPKLESEGEFLAHFGRSIVTAFLARAVTEEADREQACTSVACAVLAEIEKKAVAAPELLRRCWDETLVQIRGAGPGEAALYCQVEAPVLVEGDKIMLAGMEVHVTATKEVYAEKDDEGDLKIVMESLWKGKVDGGRLYNRKGEPARVVTCAAAGGEAGGGVLIQCLVAEGSNTVCNLLIDAAA